MTTPTPATALPKKPYITPMVTQVRFEWPRQLLAVFKLVSGPENNGPPTMPGAPGWG